jgi:small-conductance mechanosensitive channel
VPPLPDVVAEMVMSGVRFNDVDGIGTAVTCMLLPSVVLSAVRRRRRAKKKYQDTRQQASLFWPGGKFIALASVSSSSTINTTPHKTACLLSSQVISYMRKALILTILGLAYPCRAFQTCAIRRPRKWRSVIGRGMTLLDTEVATNLAIAGAIGFGADPLVEMVFNASEIENTNPDEAEFKDTLIFATVNNIALAARVFGGTLLVGIIAELLKFQLPIQSDIREVAPELSSIVWGALTIADIKRIVFLQSIAGTTLGRVALYDKLIDFLIGLGAVVFSLDVLSIDAGMGLRSVLAGGGFGAIIFSLASQNLAQQIVSGFMVQSWDAFDVGDDVRLGDGIEGTIKKIGLVETEIVGFDNIAVRIPNAQLATQRVSNLSRIHRSQFRQELRFSYDDLEKLPFVLDDIKSEIKASCPKLILDGSKPFQAVLSSYENDHVQAIINCHFDIAPGSSEFVDNRQQALLAIARAIRKNEIKFALPSIYYQTNGNSIT